MKKSTGLLLALVVLALLAGGALALLTLRGKEAPTYQSKGKLEVICDVEISRPTEGLSQPFDVSHLTLPAQFDFDESTGWYTGEYTISMNRKGTLKVNDAVLEVTRPAFFKRYGLVILSEHFTLDRRSGAFRQWLDLEGEKRLELITGHCKRSNNAPF